SIGETSVLGWNQAHLSAIADREVVGTFSTRYRGQRASATQHGFHFNLLYSFSSLGLNRTSDQADVSSILISTSIFTRNFTRWVDRSDHWLRISKLPITRSIWCTPINSCPFNNVLFHTFHAHYIQFFDSRTHCKGIAPFTNQ